MLDRVYCITQTSGTTLDIFVMVVILLDICSSSRFVFLWSLNELFHAKKALLYMWNRPSEEW